jgi:SP family arabinose:H+ symporter-like MFS transporter
VSTNVAASLTDDQTAYNKTYIWFISVAAALGGLLFGYDWVVIGGAKPFYEKFFHLQTPAEIGWAMSSALIGCLVGAITSGVLSDKFGRKRLLVISALIFIITSIGTGMSNTFPVFLAWRVAGGVAIGLASNLSPMYIAEVAPRAIRGQLVSINQLTIVIGVLSAQVMNWLIARPVPPGMSDADILNSWNGQFAWRWMFGVTAVPSLLFLLVVLTVPESPRWLAKNGQFERARAVLGRIGGDAFASFELESIQQTLANDVARVDFRELLEPKMVRILALGIFLAVFQQWCGINVVFNYAQEVFSAAGYQISDILFNIVVTGAVSFAFTLVAIKTVDRLGRRPLMLIGSAGLAIIYLLLGTTYHLKLGGWPVLALVVSAVGCYSLSLAPIVWVILSEIFPNRIRGAAMAVSVFALWAGCFVLTYSFPFLNRGLGAAGTFWLYCAICVIGYIVIRLKLPETKNKSLEQIERELVD